MDDIIFDNLFNDYGEEEDLEQITDEYCRSLAYNIVSAKNICVVTGAGISVSAGIPDFRSKEGIWKKYDPAIYGSMSGFMSHPQNFWKMSMEMKHTMENKQPTKAHHALAKLQRMGKLKHIITQNVDGLHQEAGCKNVYEVHGTTKRCKCIECDYQIDFDELLYDNPKPWETIPHCPKCQNLMKLDVVLFGEELDNEIYAMTNEIITQCDLLMVIGCSMEVNPVNQFPGKAKMNHATVAMINLTGTKCDNRCDYVIRGMADDIIPKIVDYVEEFSGFLGNLQSLQVPLDLAKKAFCFVKDIVNSVISVGVQQIQLAIEEVKSICNLIMDDIKTE